MNKELSDIVKQTHLYQINASIEALDRKISNLQKQLDEAKAELMAFEEEAIFTKYGKDAVRIWSGEYSAFWAKGAKGYAYDYDSAGIFTYTEAMQHLKSAGEEKQLKLIFVDNSLNK